MQVWDLGAGCSILFAGWRNFSWHLAWIETYWGSDLCTVRSWRRYLGWFCQFGWFIATNVWTMHFWSEICNEEVIDNVCAAVIRLGVMNPCVYLQGGKNVDFDRRLTSISPARSSSPNFRVHTYLPKISPWYVHSWAQILKNSVVFRIMASTPTFHLMSLVS